MCIRDRQSSILALGHTRSGTEVFGCEGALTELTADIGNVSLAAYSTRGTHAEGDTIRPFREVFNTAIDIRSLCQRVSMALCLILSRCPSVGHEGDTMGPRDGKLPANSKNSGPSG